MKIFNSLFLIVLAVFITFISSMFWIGSFDKKQELYQTIFISFALRFLGFSIFGLIGILFLILINWIRNVIITDGKINLLKLFILGLTYILISSFVGVFLFFVIS
jgi:hypothetical protein